MTDAREVVRAFLPLVYFKLGPDYMHCDRGMYRLSIAWGRDRYASMAVFPYRHEFWILFRIPLFKIYWR